MHRKFVVACSLLTFFVLHPVQLKAGEPVNITMRSERWTALDEDSMGPKGSMQFIVQEGFPDGIMKLNGGSAALRDFSFSEGKIEYDFKPIGEEAPGIQLRATGDLDKQDAEEIYFRISKDCRASNDCIQYTPVIHGFMLWDIYPQYQHQGALLDGWNHVRIVVSRHRAQVFLNAMSEPALNVGDLQSSSKFGSIHFRGPALYANLVIASGAPANLAATPEPDPALHDAGIVRRWRVSQQVPISTLSPPPIKSLPDEPKQWEVMKAERGGLLNLNRHYFAGRQPAAINWLTFNVLSRRKITKRVSLGWVGETWIYNNGQLIQDEKNFYYPDSERKYPDGRLSLSNTSFNLDLKPGQNKIAIALYPQVRDSIRTRTKYGWGIAMRFADMRDVQFQIPSR